MILSFEMAPFLGDMFFFPGGGWLYIFSDPVFEAGDSSWTKSLG